MPLGRHILGVGIDHQNFSFISFNLGTHNVVKTPKPRNVTNYEYSILISQNFSFLKKNKGCEYHQVR